jgi:HEAT repeat protein
MNLLLLGGCTALFGPNLRTIGHAEETGSVERLLLYLQHPKHAYVRERAARALRALPSDEKSLPAVPLLRACLRDDSEKDYVRAECALTLGEWQVEAAAVDIIYAMGQSSDESRYWMAYSLNGINAPEARAELARLREDSDFFISTAARQWMGE